MPKSREDIFDLAPSDKQKRSWTARELAKRASKVAKVAGTISALAIPGAAVGAPDGYITPIDGSGQAPSGVSGSSINAGEATSVSINRGDLPKVKSSLVQELCDMVAAQRKSIPEGSTQYVQVVGSPDVLRQSKEAGKRIYAPDSITSFSLGAVKRCLVKQKKIKTGVEYKAVSNFAQPFRADSDAIGALRFEVATDLGESTGRTPSDRAVTAQTSRIFNAYDRGQLNKVPEYADDVRALTKQLSGTTLTSSVVTPEQ